MRTEPSGSCRLLKIRFFRNPIWRPVGSESQHFSTNRMVLIVSTRNDGRRRVLLLAYIRSLKTKLLFVSHQQSSYHISPTGISDKYWSLRYISLLYLSTLHVQCALDKRKIALAITKILPINNDNLQTISRSKLGIHTLR